MYDIHVHPRVREKRPWLSERRIREAWANYIASQNRRTPNSHQVVRVGIAHDGGAYEMIAVEGETGFLIYHALAPPTKPILAELGLQEVRWNAKS